MPKKVLAIGDQYRILFNDSKDAMFISTIEGKFLDVNQAMLDLFGYSKEEMLALDIKSMYKSPGVRKKVIEKTTKLKAVSDLDIQLYTKEGKLIDLSLTASIWKDSKKRPVGIQGILRDVTTEKLINRLMHTQRDLSVGLSVAFELEEVLCLSLEASIHISGMDCGAIYLFDEEVKSLEMVFHKGLSKKFVRNASHYAKNSKQVKLVKAGRPVFISHKDLVQTLKLNDISSNEGLKTIAIVPIHHENKIIGSLNVSSHLIENIDEFTKRALETIAAQIGSAIVRVKSEKKIINVNKELLKSNKRLKCLALRDSHTNLYNHRHLHEVIEKEFDRARRHTSPLSVIMLDIDYFKSINDVYGHHFGDLVLKQFALQLKKTVRHYDMVFRFGGEEFVIVSPGNPKTDAIKLAERILEKISLFNFGNKKSKVKLKITVSVVSYPEDKIFKSSDLMQKADYILNKAKEDGGDRVYSQDNVTIKKEKENRNKKEENEVHYLKDRIDKLNKRANQSLMEAIFAFAKTIKAKDQYTGEHVELTVFYATEMAKEIGLSQEEIDFIKQGAMLHDLGKIGISEELLKKKRLTKKEFDILKQHPQIGVDIIRPIHFLHKLIPLILYHHERWDGNGYPIGLKGEEIPYGARIICLADAYQAITSDRPYRKARSKETAMEIIKENAGSQFDPDLVDVLVRILQRDHSK